MNKNINEIGLNQILPLFICKDINDSMRDYILKHTYTYSIVDDDSRGCSYYSFLDGNGHEIAKLISGDNFPSMLMGFDDTNTFKLMKFEKPAYSYYSANIDKVIRRIDSERAKDLNKTLVILQELLKPEYYARTTQFAFCTHVWEEPKKHIIFTQELKKVITIQYNQNTDSYDIIYINNDIYRDLLSY